MSTSSLHCNTPNKPLRVTLISHSDLMGGAAVVTYRLMQAMRREGVDARMVVFTKMSDDPDIAVIGSRSVRGFRFLQERGRIALANGMNRSDLFKVSIANVGMALHRHPWVKEADAIMLGWINQGLASLEEIKKLGNLGKPIIWTMHDMWNLTGICHHAYECVAYTADCGCCPFLGGTGFGDLSHKIWLEKRKLYDSVPITFVAVSNWLARKCKSSKLMADRDIRVIPNAFPVDSFPAKSMEGVLPPGISTDRKLILFGAARIDDPIKGLNYAIDALNYLFDNEPELSTDAMAVFFGDIKQKRALDSLRFPYIYTGRISDTHSLHRLYASAHVVLSTSLYETLPGTLIEGQAAGCLSVTFGQGGQDDIVEHLENGYIAEYKNPRSVAEGIRWAMKQTPDREAMHESVRKRFSSNAVAEKYLSLINELLE